MTGLLGDDGMRVGERRVGRSLRRVASEQKRCAHFSVTKSGRLQANHFAEVTS